MQKLLNEFSLAYMLCDTFLYLLPFTPDGAPPRPCSRAQPVPAVSANSAACCRLRSTLPALGPALSSAADIVFLVHHLISSVYLVG